MLTHFESNAENLLASYILQNQKKGMFTSKLTITAEALGISYRHLIRTMNALCDKNLIRKESRHYYIVDQKGLTELSNKTYHFYS